MKKKYQPEIHDKAWGREHWIANNDLYCGKKMEIAFEYRCSYHRHLVKDETFFVEKGLILLEYSPRGGETPSAVVLKPGDVFRIPVKTWHRFTAIFDSVIFEFSTTHDDLDVERMTISGFIEGEEFKKISAAVLSERTKGDFSELEIKLGNIREEFRPLCP